MARKRTLDDVKKDLLKHLGLWGNEKSLEQKDDYREIALKFGLTERQTEVLDYIMKGFTDKEIGKMLEVSAKAASAHVSNILEKTGVARRTQLIANNLLDD